MHRFARFAIVLSLVLVGCGSKGGDGASSSSGAAAKRKPHDPVTGPAMYTVHIDEVTVQQVSNGKLEGEPRVVSDQPRGKNMCRMEKDPGNDVVTTWFEGSFDDSGHSKMTHEKDKAVPADLVSCVIQPVINMKLGISAGEYRVTVKAWFDEPQPQPR